MTRRPRRWPPRSLTGRPEASSIGLARRPPPCPHARLARTAAALWTVALCAGCETPGALRTVVPDVAPAMAQHLVEDDSTAFARFIADRGIVETLAAHAALLDAVPGPTSAATRRRLDRLHPHLARLTDELSRTYRYHRPRRVLAWLRRVGPREDSTWFDLRARVVALSAERGGGLSRTAEHAASVTRREAATESLVTRARALGEEGCVVPLFGSLAAVHGAHGDRVEQGRWVRRSIAASRRAGSWTQLCQDLGVLGVLHDRGGRTDSMAVCWNEALEIARRIRHPEQAPRIASFYADHFWREGRLELAHQWLEESLRLCREFKGRNIEVRFLLRSAEWHAERACWTVVARDLDRIDRLASGGRDARLTVHRFDARLLRARSWLATGRVEAASGVFRSLESESKNEPIRPYSERIGKMYRCWAEGSVGSAPSTQVRAVIDRGSRFARAYRVAGLEPLLSLSTARLALQQGDADACRRALEAFRSTAGAEPGIPPEAWVRHDALRLRAALQRGSREGARMALGSGMRRLRGLVAGVDASARGYLFIESCRALRLAGHEFHRADAEAALAFDTEWRGLAESLGGEATGRPRIARTAAVPTTRAPLGTIGIRFLVAEDAVFRWTITSSHVRLERLDATSEWVRRQVTAVSEALARGRGDRRRDVDETLHALAEALLPIEVREPSPLAEPTRLAIAPDGILEQLPFAALNLSARAYVPLVRRFDVVMDRALPRRPATRSSDLALVIADPWTSDALRRRVRLPPLPHARDEAARWAALQANPLVLQGRAATKSNLTSRWAAAGSLYFATHVVRDGEAPYLQFLGLAEDDDRAPAGCVLDVSDIRRAPLGSCELVVLSGCESGAGWSPDPTHAPSLGDAFLDAGAGAVVHTLWPVRDAAAPRIMGRFMEAWRERPGDAATAMARSQRALSLAPDGERAGDARLEWAGYVVKVRNALAESGGTDSTFARRGKSPNRPSHVEVRASRMDASRARTLP